MNNTTSVEAYIVPPEWATLDSDVLPGARVEGNIWKFTIPITSSNSVIGSSGFVWPFLQRDNYRWVRNVIRLFHPDRAEQHFQIRVRIVPNAIELKRSFESYDPSKLKVTQIMDDAGNFNINVFYLDVRFEQDDLVPISWQEIQRKTGYAARVHLEIVYEGSHIQPPRKAGGPSLYVIGLWTWILVLIVIAVVMCIMVFRMARDDWVAAGRGGGFVALAAAGAAGAAAAAANHGGLREADDDEGERGPLLLRNEIAAARARRAWRHDGVAWEIHNETDNLLISTGIELRQALAQANAELGVPGNRLQFMIRRLDMHPYVGHNMSESVPWLECLYLMLDKFRRGAALGNAGREWRERLGQPLLSAAEIRTMNARFNILTNDFDPSHLRPGLVVLYKEILPFMLALNYRPLNDVFIQTWITDNATVYGNQLNLRSASCPQGALERVITVFKFAVQRVCCSQDNCDVPLLSRLCIVFLLEEIQNVDQTAGRIVNWTRIPNPEYASYTPQQRRTDLVTYLASEIIPGSRNEAVMLELVNRIGAFLPTHPRFRSINFDCIDKVDAVMDPEECETDASGGGLLREAGGLLREASVATPGHVTRSTLAEYARSIANFRETNPDDARLQSPTPQVAFQVAVERYNLDMALTRLNDPTEVAQRMGVQIPAAMNLNPMKWKWLFVYVVNAMRGGWVQLGWVGELGLRRRD